MFSYSYSMRFFALTKFKVIFTFLLSIIVIFFYVPFLFSYCMPISGDFGGGGCGLISFNTPVYLLPHDIRDHGVNFAFYPFYTLLQNKISPEDGSFNGIFHYYPYFFVYSFFILIFSYAFACSGLFVASKFKKTQKHKN